MSASPAPLPAVTLAAEPDFALGALGVSPSTCRLRHAAGEQRVERRVMEVLVALYRRRGQTVTRDQLVEACWGGRVVSDDAVNRAIAELRRHARTLGADALQIETVPRVGFMLLDERMAALSGTAATNAAAGAATPAEGEDSRRDLSIAVLPFANLSDDPDQDYFGDGMVVEIVAALSRYSSLFVIASASSLTYRDPTRKRAEIAAELGVRYILEGGVQAAGDRLRISAQLADGLDGGQVWAERFDGESGDVFALQDQIAQGVAGQIGPALVTAEMRRARRRPTQDLTAHGLYLRSLDAARAWTPGGFLKARDLLEAAIDLDPHYADALAGAAFLHGYVAYLTPDPKAFRARARELGRRALEAGGEDAQVLTRVAGMMTYARGALDAAEDMIELAKTRNPSLAEAWLTGGWIKLFQGKAGAAMSHFETAKRLDPRSLFRVHAVGGIGLALLLLERFEVAIQPLREAAELSPDQFGSGVGLAIALARFGRLDQAKGVLERLPPYAVPLTLVLFRDAEARERLRSGLVFAGMEFGDSA